MKKIMIMKAFILLTIVSMAQNAKDAKMHQFVNNLMSKMTLEEKLGQLNLPASSDFVTGAVSSSDIAEKVKAGKVGGVFNIRSVTKIKELQEFAVNNTRLHIPLLFGMDVIHGYRTIFPIPLGMSATWDMGLIERSAQIAASEASADGIQWTFSPMVDLTRDPRWGRTSEGNGEDAFLSSAIAKAMIHGYQGDDLAAPNTIMSCVKHYALYGAAEGGRDYNTTDMSRVRMYNEYFPPYKAAVVADETLPEFKLHMLNAHPGIPDREGITYETAFVGKAMRRHPRLKYIPSRLSLLPVLIANYYRPDAVFLNTPPIS